MRFTCALFSLMIVSAFPILGAVPATFAETQEGITSHGFRARAVYLNDADEPFGARFVHESTGFTLDLIQVQSVPQAFFWVTTFPTSDKGEPHTQEHLLVTKGNSGRMLAASEAITLTEFTAFTTDTRTCYAFNTKANLDVFYQQFAKVLGALLAPDYTDEEVRREVRNFGVAQNPTTHKYRLEEKGAVYNEMVSSTANPYSALFRQIGLDEYGPHHSLGYNAGGEPAAIRELGPADIRKFHDEHYFLRNMGAIVSLSKGEPIAATLARVDAILNRAPMRSTEAPVVSEDTLPAAQPARAGSIQVVDFPFENGQQPGHIALAWPADRTVKERQRMLLNLFVATFAGDPDTNLYRLFINRTTRKMDLGAQGVFGFASQEHGSPVIVAFTDVPAVNVTEAKIAEVRTLVQNELARVANFPDGSQELAGFNARVGSRLRDRRRQLSKLVNSPPRFGARDGSDFWVSHLYELNREPGFRKSVTLKSDSTAIAKMLESNKNIWRDLLAQWRLLDDQPYGIAAQSSPELLKNEQQARLARANAEVKKLEMRYGVSDGQTAIRDYLNDYTAETARLDKLAEQASMGTFVENPPLTLDDQLDYGISKLPNDVPLVASKFDNMTSATTGLALRLDSTPENDLPLLSLLPQLLTQSGVVIDGKPVPYEEMKQRLRDEILSLDSSFDSDVRSGRVELTLSAAGNDVSESRRALEWMRLVLLHPYWQPENLPRLRDLADQVTSNLREELQGPEEAWVRGPMLAYAEQTHPLYLTTSSLLTRIYNGERLRWMLKDAGTPEDRRAALEFLDELGAAGEKSNASSPRADLASVLAAFSGTQTNTAALSVSAAALKARFDALPEGAKRVAKNAGADLTQMLSDLPDSTLTADWSSLCKQMRDDLAVTPEKTLERLNALRERLLNTSNARVWMVGSEQNERQLQPLIAKIVDEFDKTPATRVNYGSLRRIEDRARQHQEKNAASNFAGFFDPNLQGGVIESMVPFASYIDTNRDALLNILAVQLFAGHGLHTLYTKTTGVGLAYSNGIRGATYDGWWGYYAERVPEVPQTLHFAMDVVKKQPRQPALAEYAIAQSFQEANAADTYEMRAAAMADEVADGITPEKVKSFRRALLSLRSDSHFAAEIFSRVDAVYGTVLPGYGPKVKDVPQGLYFMIGSKKQFDAMNADLFSREDQDVLQLFPRDFWMLPTDNVSAAPASDGSHSYKQ